MIVKTIDAEESDDLYADVKMTWHMTASLDYLCYNSQVVKRKIDQAYI